VGGESNDDNDDEDEDDELLRLSQRLAETGGVREVVGTETEESKYDCSPDSGHMLCMLHVIRFCMKNEHGMENLCVFQLFP